MQIHEIKRNTKLKKHRTIGRGGKRGTTSGRGTKGQIARAGHKLRPELRDIIKKLPKRRGYSAPRFADKPLVVNLLSIEGVFENGAIVSPTTLAEKKLIDVASGRTLQVKILGSGELTKKLSFSGVDFSASAKAKIEKAGGTITLK
ncbi:MAG: 50S ribosomal protein L15 [Patescibacteria group bacterium]